MYMHMFTPLCAWAYLLRTTHSSLTRAPNRLAQAHKRAWKILSKSASATMHYSSPPPAAGTPGFGNGDEATGTSSMLSHILPSHSTSVYTNGAWSVGTCRCLVKYTYPPCRLHTLTHTHSVTNTHASTHTNIHVPTGGYDDTWTNKRRSVPNPRPKPSPTIPALAEVRV